jgi:hypothetical protein
MTASRRFIGGFALTVGLLVAPLAGSAAAAPTQVHKVGVITWHASRYVSRIVTVVGFVLAQGPGYVLFSDEPTGKISSHDLPVTGAAVDSLTLTKKYKLEGRFVSGGFAASNGSPYHLELTAAPQMAGK